ncbi:uncharacterized protein PFL1_05579 [Pseudozyma flocculosa PF-1]|uniref:HORMA domain-containing protein n=1 Tax=Pseudozyma flocculosa PF-1 TaxID=1277687 RepID=A0A061H4P7_9BASI|nr:uncharacterized protein PFL1_05579 [Pseudozyma flocculosa PF-1]EPQ26945.1 hypothetical protein PFL1_05579 [Pseudozyma flocculosa PF-1]
MAHTSNTISLSDSTKAVWECFLLTLGLIASNLNLVPDSALQWHRLPGSLPSDHELPTVRPGGCEVGDAIVRYAQGVRDALNRQYLSGACLILHNERNPDAGPARAFTFSFVYRSIGDVILQKPLMRLKMNGTGGTVDRRVKAAPSLDAVCKTIKTFLTRVEASFAEMQATKEDTEPAAFLTFSLAYTLDTPRDYQPNGFVPMPAKAAPLATYRRGRPRVGRFDLGHHRAHFHVWAAGDDANAASTQQSTQESSPEAPADITGSGGDGAHAEANGILRTQEQPKEEVFGTSRQARSLPSRARFAENHDLDVPESFPSTLSLAADDGSSHQADAVVRASESKVNSQQSGAAGPKGKRARLQIGKEARAGEALIRGYSRELRKRGAMISQTKRGATKAKGG